MSPVNAEINIMGNSLKDQLLKKGLVTKKQVNKALNEKRASRSKKGNKEAGENDQVQKKIQQAREKQAAHVRELNRQKNETAREKEIQDQIRQIINKNVIEMEGDISFHFVDNKKIKKLFVSKKIAEDLSKGRMGVVRENERYSVVPAKAAIQIQDRKAGCVILLNTPETKDSDPDDPYSEFPIPDDLEW